MPDGTSLMAAASRAGAAPAVGTTMMAAASRASPLHFSQSSSRKFISLLAATPKQSASSLLVWLIVPRRCRMRSAKRDKQRLAILLSMYSHRAVGLGATGLIGASTSSAKLRAFNWSIKSWPSLS